MLRVGKTMPKPCPFRTLFVPFSCPIRISLALAADRSCSLATSPGSSLVVIAIAWSLYHSPPRCAGGKWRRNGFLGNAVFEGERREKILDFLPGAQRGRCALVRADDERPGMNPWASFTHGSLPQQWVYNATGEAPAVHQPLPPSRCCCSWQWSCCGCGAT